MFWPVRLSGRHWTWFQYKKRTSIHNIVGICMKIKTNIHTQNNVNKKAKYKLNTTLIAQKNTTAITTIIASSIITTLIVNYIFTTIKDNHIFTLIQWTRHNSSLLNMNLLIKLFYVPGWLHSLFQHNQLVWHKFGCLDFLDNAKRSFVPWERPQITQTLDSRKRSSVP